MPRTPGTTRRPLRTAGATLVGLGLMVASATAASAHVRVIPETTAAGAWSVLTFRVPSELPKASTTKVVIDLPTDTPLTHVGVRPIPGWTAEVQDGDLPKAVDVDGATITKAPLHVVFTADKDGAVGPGQFQEFELQVGPLPTTVGAELDLPAHQTYSDGTVVDWDEPMTGADEPEDPVPAFTITAAEPEDGAAPPTPEATAESTPMADATAAAAPAAATSTDDDSGSDSLARWLGGLGLLLGAAALVVAVVTSRRGRTQP